MIEEKYEKQTRDGTEILLLCSIDGMSCIGNEAVSQSKGNKKYTEGGNTRVTVECSVIDNQHIGQNVDKS